MSPPIIHMGPYNGLARNVFFEKYNLAVSFIVGYYTRRWRERGALIYTQKSLCTIHLILYFPIPDGLLCRFDKQIASEYGSRTHSHWFRVLVLSRWAVRYRLWNISTNISAVSPKESEKWLLNDSQFHPSIPLPYYHYLALSNVINAFCPR